MKKEAVQMLKTPKKLNNKQMWTIILFLYVGIGGMSFQVWGPLMSNFEDAFGISRTLLGLIAPVGTLSFATVALITGMFAGRIRLRRALLIGIGLSTGMTFLIGFSPIYPVFLALIALRGITGGVPGALCRPFLGHLYSENRMRILNINEAIWAVGATCGPIFATLVLGFGSWRLVFILIGLLFIPIVFLIGITDSPEEGFKEKPITLKDLREMLKHPILIGILLALFFNVGVEGGFFKWLTYYLEGTFPKSVASLALSGFIAAYIPGRFFNGWLSEKFEHYQLVLVNSGAVTFLLVLAFFFLSGYPMIAVVPVIGFFISGVFPNLFVWGVELFPEYSGPINGLVMAVDPLGLSVIPFLMGLIGDNYSMAVAMQFMVIPMILVVVIGLVLRGISRR